ncbi:methionyl-tRNA formyltransferase [Acuticoccus sp. MNP-M23]|uniref:methionyl-tRNA formyltransferase n=1 Tax=Acuticoccus sp. MNP-M23 TaxID=3072793 RepID=UPI0028160F8D|nr:methionyl-tRNA formyltransferase [Acuticoccus sp. MNP-M23]WMS41246.1 methionyl-tRNA formyltransferase [Acuticoccus sp. MNP-M23]
MMRIVFMGTPDFAVPTLMEIAGQGHDIAAVYTQPPRPAGRGMGDRPSAVHEAADALGLDVHHPVSLKDRADEIAAYGADVLVVVAYGLILPQAVLDAAELGAFNLHASLLPRWRGAAPIARAIMAGDAETGVGVMKMEAGLDTGPVAMEERIPIGPTDTAGELTTRLSRLGADLMVRALGGLERGALGLTAQPDEGVEYARKIDKAEAGIDFSQPAEAVRAHINGLSPWPGAHASIEIGGKAERLKVLLADVADGAGAPGEILDDALHVACGTGAVKLLRVQRAGKGAVGAGDFLRGARVGPGDSFLPKPAA